MKRAFDNDSFTTIVVAILVMLSVILTASVLFPAISGVHIVAILIGGTVLVPRSSIRKRVLAHLDRALNKTDPT